ncbi:MAG: lysophospholipid acyltransferase family protein [Acidobacteriota bacterium]
MDGLEQVGNLPSTPILPPIAARLTLKLLGWRLEGSVPAHPKYVLVGVPHTSNWDVPLFVLMTSSLGIKAYQLAKESLFRWPLAGLMRWLGMLPIDRSSSQDYVQQFVNIVKRQDRLVLAVSPEGTRKWTDYWRSGFYYIALGAEVPIALAFADYPTKVTGIGLTLEPSGDILSDMEVVRAFYRDKRGKRPENQGPIRVRTPGS